MEGELAFIDGEWVVVTRVLPDPPRPPVKPMRRPGCGSIYFRPDGLWLGRVELPRVDGKRKYKTVSSTKFCHLLRKFSAIVDREKFEAALARPRSTPLTRGRHMRDAQELGTHTSREWGAKCRAQNHHCFYCGRRALLVKEHLTPVSRGGSDSIDNIVGACAKCNFEKGRRTLEEFTADWIEMPPHPNAVGTS